MSYKVPLLDLVAQYQEIKPEIDAAIQRVLDSGQFILGKEVESFENEISEYLGMQHSVGVASGTDALMLSLRALKIGPGDEVILPTFTFFSTVSVVMHLGAKPVLVDIDPRTFCINSKQIEDVITPKTKAIIPVHLYGHPADMKSIIRIAGDHNLKIIEDNAQAFGADYKGKKTGSIGDVSCLSFFPSKNLGGYGDGGMVVTNSAKIADRVRQLRVHGWKQKYFPEMLGYNSRLDALQAAVLRVKLRYVDQWNEQRREIAKSYSREFADNPRIQIPFEEDDVKHVYHLYVIQSHIREQIQKKFNLTGIASGVYYPQPLHKTEPCLELGYQEGSFPVAEKASQEVLAIPIYPSLDEDQGKKIVECINEVA